MSLARLQGIRPGAIGIFAGALSSQPATVQRLVAIEIERLGFGTLWFGEAAGREAFAQASIFLSATSELVVASGIANIWARDPAAMAGGARALAEAWPGRFILGLGVSHAPMVQARGHDYSKPVTSMNRYLDGMGAAPWRGPVAAMPPVVLAALGPRMMALAAERTAGAYPYFTTSAHVRQARDQLGPDAFLAVDLPVVLASKLSEAREVGNAHMNRYLGLENYRNSLIRLGFGADALEAPGTDELFDAIFAWGDAPAIRRRILASSNAGADQVVLNLITRDGSAPYLPELRALAP